MLHVEETRRDFYTRTYCFSVCVSMEKASFSDLTLKKSVYSSQCISYICTRLGIPIYISSFFIHGKKTNKNGTKSKIKKRKRKRFVCGVLSI